MLEGRQRNDWSIASSCLSVIANLQRDPKRSRRLTPSDFDPFAQRSHAHRPITVPVSVLKDVFIDGKVPRIAQEVHG